MQTETKLVICATAVAVMSSHAYIRDTALSTLPEAVRNAYPEELIYEDDYQLCEFLSENPLFAEFTFEELLEAIAEIEPED